MNVVEFVFVASFLAVFAVVLWGLRRYERVYPEDVRLAEHDERRRGLRWFGLVRRGGERA